MWDIEDIRPGTPGAGLPGQVPEEVKTERLARLQDVLARQQTAFNKSLIGKTLPILIENKSRGAEAADADGNFELFGRAPYLQGTHLRGSADLIGTIVPVVITDAGRNSLNGSLAQKDSHA